MVSQQCIDALTKLALANFVDLYAVAKKNNGFKGPDEDELFEMMCKEIEGLKVDEPVEKVVIDSSSPERDEVEEETQEEVPAPVAVAPTPESLPTPVAPTPTPTPTPTPSLSPSIDENPKVSSKELKKFTVTETKTTKSGETKEVETIFELPYLPHCIDYSGTCQAIKCNGGLMTPCLTRPAKDSQYCRVCAKNNMCYGTVADREQVEVGSYEIVLKNGEKSQKKHEISYGTWLSKRNMDRKHVETLLKERFGDAISIPESYYEVNKLKARRGVKKTPSTSSDDETSSVEEVAAEETSKTQTPQKKVSQKKTTTQKKKGRPASPKAETVNIPLPKSEKKQKNKKASSPAPEPVVEETEPIVDIQEKPPTISEETERDLVEEDYENEDFHQIVYNGKVFTSDNENVLYLIENDDTIPVGTWDPEEEICMFNSEYSHFEE